MNINDISTTKSAQFYKLKKPLTKTKIILALGNASEKKIGNYIAKEIKTNYITPSHIEIHYSFVCFKISTEPSFLQGTDLREIKFSFVLLIEFDDTLVVFKKNADLPETGLSEFIEDFEYEQFCHFQGDKNPEYERVTMKNMSISNAVIRSRSLEAKNLDGIVSSNYSSRAIPSNFRLKSGQEVFTLTPNTARIGYRDKKSNFDQIVDWAFETKEEIKRTTRCSTFINSFASPINLSDILEKGYNLSALLIDTSEIEEKIEKGELFLYVNGATLSQEKANRLFGALKSPLLIENNFLKSKGRNTGSSVKTSTRSISIKSKIFESITLAEDGVADITLNSYLNKTKPFSAVFDTPTYSYYSRSCFEDRNLVNSLPSILNVFDDSFDLGEIFSEKQKPHLPNITEFPENSLFRSIESTYCEDHEIIICDDMNDEWADHIAIDYTSPTPSISFIHSKFIKKDSQGASAFHEVVAQALKNIGRTQANTETYRIKYETKWINNYEDTQIKRVTRANDWNELESALKIVENNPNSLKKIVLATPFIKKTELIESFREIEEGIQCKPHTTQLIWLINTFISCCKEYGVQAKILCKP